MNVSILQRLFWTIGFLCALAMMIYVIQMLATRYNKQQFKTVINSTNYPIYRIVFPEIYLCNDNRLNWARFAAAKENFLRPEHHNTELEQLFTEVVALYDTFSFGTFDRFKNLSTRPLKDLDYVNFTSVAQFMSWRCDELLKNCVWQHRPMNCCDIFMARRSLFGFCMAFNTLETAEAKLRQKFDDKWPWHVAKNGAYNGLNVQVRINERLQSPFSQNQKGIMFMIMEPGVWFSYPNKVKLSDKLYVRMYAKLSFYDQTTQRIPSRVRNCVFDQERNSLDFKTLLNHDYKFENCQAECLQEYTMRFCNCTMDIFFPPSQYPPCKLSDMPCLAKYNNRLLHFEQSDEREYIPLDVQELGMTCNCYLNCLSLAYFIDIRTFFLPDVTQEPNNSFVNIDFHFQYDTIVVFRTTVVYTWVDLLVNFGNATALFLGCSLISAVELVYYFCIYFPQRLWRVNSKVKTPLKRISYNYDGKLLEKWMMKLLEKIL
ncbi:pickpocket protein 19-like [Ceratitis capitata]|uniref:pickpocket protein 19-like n=1 Tax=Ceratitis capitata TaxID=7213 RepID=UPI000A0F9C57|nr:pickpocket protein 19-like [Ceratitis capitata]